MEYRDWILMVHNKEAGFLQHGPYTYSEVEEKLKSGEIKSSDLAWKMGFKNWVAVESLKQKHSEDLKEIEDPISLHHMEYLKRESIQTAQSLTPPEATSENLVTENFEGNFAELINWEMVEPILPQKSVFIEGGGASPGVFFHFENKKFQNRLGFSIKKNRKPLVVGLVLLVTGLMLMLSLLLI